MKIKQIKNKLKQGKKIATLSMVKNGDYLKLKEGSSTVVRSWGGNEQTVGDKYFTREVDNTWQEFK